MGKENRSIIINGVGSILTTGAGGKLAPIGSLQSLRLDFTVTEDPVYGGDGLFPIDYVTRDKNVAITATNAKFDLNILRLATGATVGEAASEDSYTWVLNKIGTVKKVGTSPDFRYVVDIFADGTPFSSPEYTVMDMATGDALEEDSAVAEGKFIVTEKEDEDEIVIERELEFDASMEGKRVMYSFKKVTQNISIAEGQKSDIPVPIKIIHQGNFKQKDDTWQGIETEIKLAKASGTFTIDYARATASAPSLSLNMLDPEDGTCRLWTMKRFVTTAPPCM